MSMTFNQLLLASKSDIEVIRKQPAGYCRTPLTINQLANLRFHLSSLYIGRVQSAFAYSIYMKAA